ncbi:MAG: D-alanine--D-alanine ligase [Gammaproteobacteria bacterium]|nr:D-alanine--D-alanine ligase [Gammaproteobacteria bacterium]MDH5728801.1 D-alanine--D-alanine ligase [Gammaproteobacteria bacterium]
MTDYTKLFGKVAVLLGGKSAEREISLLSGDAVLQALKRQGVDAHALDVGDDVLERLQQGKFDRVFNMLHGRMGEDGVIQGVLEVMDLPYTGSGVMASAICMDKLKTKEIWCANQLPTPEFRVVTKADQLEQVNIELGFPVIVKPIHEGSSIGMSKVTHADELYTAWETAREFDHQVLIEKWVVGKEYTVAILNDQVLPAICLETPNDFYDFEAKYKSDTTRYLCPCGLHAEQEAILHRLCEKAFAVVGASGWGRVDLMLDAQQQPWLIEVNTLPGMTDHSLVPMAAKQAGISFDELVIRILNTSFEHE